jgi:NAD(P)-dependent dehydrogenase (short-subunit alcohol dehydrogenase family)
MVNLRDVETTNATLAQSRPLVAVFVGGTNGIGEQTLRALANAHGKSGKSLRIYCVGRKQDAAEKIFDDCRRRCPNGDFRFVKAVNLTLISDVDQCCEEIISLERQGGLGGGSPRIDLLCQSQGFVRFEKPECECSEVLQTPCTY